MPVVSVSSERGERTSPITAAYRVGLGIALGAILTGWAWALLDGERSTTPVRLGHLFDDGSPADRLLGFGVLVLSAAPALVVFVLALSWWRRGERGLALVGFAVILVLGVSTLVGHA